MQLQRDLSAASDADKSLSPCAQGLGQHVATSGHNNGRLQMHEAAIQCIRTQYGASFVIVNRHILKNRCVHRHKTSHPTVAFVQSFTRAVPGPSCPQRSCAATTSPRTAPSYLQFISLHLLLKFYWRRLWPPPPHRSPTPFPACRHQRSRARSPPGLHRWFMWYPAATLRSCDMRLDTLPFQGLLSRCVAL